MRSITIGNSQLKQPCSSMGTVRGFEPDGFILAEQTLLVPHSPKLILQDYHLPRLSSLLSALAAGPHRLGELGRKEHGLADSTVHDFRQVKTPEAKMRKLLMLHTATYRSKSIEKPLSIRQRNVCTKTTELKREREREKCE